MTWQLIDGRTGRGVGSGDIDGEMRDVIALQVVNFTILLAPMGCGPAAPLWRIVG